MLSLMQVGTDQAYAARSALGARQLLLLASDGSIAAAAATRVTAALAADRGSEVRVISVVSPQLYPPPISDGGIGIPIGEMAIESQAERRRHTIGSQIASAGLHADNWPIDIEVGPPASVIVREARRQCASLVALGLRSHGTMQRWLRDETALRVVRESPVPVLAVTPGLTALPQRAALAVDFSRASLRAARAAIEILAPNSSVFVVYVRPEMDRNEENEGVSFIYSQGVVAAFARLRRELTVPTGVHVEAVMLQGEPAAEIMSFAERADIDLISVGSHRHPFLTRLLVGSVTTALVRDARISLLVSPPTPPRSAG